jgi:hypothetical protein
MLGPIGATTANPPLDLESSDLRVRKPTQTVPISGVTGPTAASASSETLSEMLKNIALFPAVRISGKSNPEGATRGS